MDLTEEQGIDLSPLGGGYRSRVTAEEFLKTIVERIAKTFEEEMLHEDSPITLS